MLLISSSLATAGASVVTSVPWEAAWCCASCWQTAASSNAETSGVCSKNLECSSINRSLFNCKITKHQTSNCTNLNLLNSKWCIWNFCFNNCSFRCWCSCLNLLLHKLLLMLLYKRKRLLRQRYSVDNLLIWAKLVATRLILINVLCTKLLLVTK